jgi:4-hydroxy-tetrahydrodipicolinate reductase
LPANGVAVTADLIKAVQVADVVIDFSRPIATMPVVTECVKQRRPLVIGTTGFSDEIRAQIVAAGQHTAIMMSPNMSVGVNLLFALARIATQSVGLNADAEIIEAHHRHKVDAPSGTALRLGEVVAQARGRTLADVRAPVRDGHTGARAVGSIGFSVIRAGEIVGDHTLLLATDNEHLEIRHQAFNRMSFADGALRAAHWLQGKAAGFYDMDDVLGLRGAGIGA